MKFGLLMHWGPYSQWGIVESWSICSEDEGWCARKSDNYVEYKKEYENLQSTFNPTKFDPNKWAEAAAGAGMKYVVFTTKHHDGFCMFDSKYTDYKITGTKTPFHTQPKANVTLEIFNAFRDKGLWAGAYFSKPDWHSPYYWWPNFATPDRNVNYDVTKYPERWENFVQYTQNQIRELMSDYGPLDILWLDGGWVRTLTNAEISRYINDPGYKFMHVQSQDIRMDELVQKAREKQPGLIVVDRAVPGKNQNYLTPENRVPETELPYPWESCIISGGGWSFTPDAKYKSVREAVHLLVDVVAKGGNLLLNVAPGPDGEWQQGAYDLLAGIGDWMEVNSSALYGCSARAPYKRGDVCVVDGADGSVYAIVLASEDELAPPASITVPGVTPTPGSAIRMLGDDRPLQWRADGSDVVIELPEALRNALPCAHAWTLRIG